MQKLIRRLDHNLKRQILDYLTKYTVTNQLSKVFSKLERGEYRVKKHHLFTSLRIRADNWIQLNTRNYYIFFRIRLKAIYLIPRNKNTLILDKDLILKQYSDKKFLIEVWNFIKQNNLKSGDMECELLPIKMERDFLSHVVSIAYSINSWHQDVAVS